MLCPNAGREISVRRGSGPEQAGSSGQLRRMIDFPERTFQAMRVIRKRSAGHGRQVGDAEIFQQSSQHMRMDLAAGIVGGAILMIRRTSMGGGFMDGSEVLHEMQDLSAAHQEHGSEPKSPQNSNVSPQHAGHIARLFRDVKRCPSRVTRTST